MNSGRATILILDDDESVCRSLSRMLRVIGHQVKMFTDPHELLANPPVQAPACLILDLRLGRVNGFDFLSILREKGHVYPVIFLTAYGDVQTAVQAMREGAQDFIEKPYDPGVLAAAVSSALKRSRAEAAAQTELSQLKARASLLTQRERQVIGFVIEGSLNKEIASELGLAEITVKIHRGRAVRKLGARNPAQLARMAALLKLIHPPLTDTKG